MQLSKDLFGKSSLIIKTNRYLCCTKMRIYAIMENTMVIKRDIY